MIKLIMYQQVKKFKDAGCTWRDIASRTGLDVKTVKKYSKTSLTVGVYDFDGAGLF